MKFIRSFFVTHLEGKESIMQNSKSNSGKGFTGKALNFIFFIALLFSGGLVERVYSQPGPDGAGIDHEGARGPGGLHGLEGPKPFGGPGLEGIPPKLRRELNLTFDQQKKFKEAHLAVQKRKIQLQGEKAIIELDLKNILSTYPVNTSEAMKMGEKMADIERKLLLLRVESWSQFLAGLTVAQHRKAMDIQEDLKEKRKAWRKEGREGREGKSREP